MAIYNYTDTGGINLNLNLTTVQAKALSRFITAHGGGESSYSTVRHLNEELRSMIVKAYTAIKDDAEFSLKYGNFDEPVEYDVDFISQEDAKANRDELAEQKMADELDAEHGGMRYVDELEDEIPF